MGPRELVNKIGDAAVYTVTATTAPSSRATEDLVSTLRNDVIPKATKGAQMSTDVGGTTASYIDLASEISSKLPLVIGIVLVLSFFLLLLAFRSLLVPLKAVVMNVFSILDAFGVVTYAFNHDWTARMIGLEGSIPIVSFVLVPAIMSLLGSSGWWLPKWMVRATPKFSIEGNEWFAERETPVEQASALQEKPEVHRGRSSVSKTRRPTELSSTRGYL
jgi:uncharacterized membrane protein YdfJ with MMPL/SSD domain